MHFGWLLTGVVITLVVVNFKTLYSFVMGLFGKKV